jgi:hypothetical protein
MNEIQATFSLRVANGSFVDQCSPPMALIDQAAIGRGGYVQTISTDETVVNFGDIVTNGWCLLQNLDAVNYVTYGPELAGAMVPFGKLEPGEWAWLRIAPSVVMRAQADYAPLQLDVRIYND